ncbi:hypothetical protein Goarm_005297 [Gossypium armourianum]|uniref:Uncharacterized protein n=1 Tax=Gossypium armourianum TaxID=34283 RepID=A0A7J9JZK0_9ROSI|nr:hypothetical protein [Gossypium armourianum]
MLALSIAFANTRRISRFLVTVSRKPARCLILSRKPTSIWWIAVVINWPILFVLGLFLIVVICLLRWIILVISITL